MTKLAEIFDKTLAERFLSSGYDRLAQGVYVQSKDNTVWRGLWVVFSPVASRLSALPNLGVFCPEVSRLVEGGLKQTGRDTISKLGAAIVTHPLYDCVRVLCGEDRIPFSYDVETVYQIDDAAKLIYEDFCKVADKFFGHISSTRDLRDHVVSHPSGPGAGVFAMALSYLLNKKISFDEIDSLARISPSPMTRKFSMYLKNKIGA